MLERHFTVNGDLIEMGLGGEFNIIIHGCNCQNVMGAGIAMQIKRDLPAAWRADFEFSASYRPEEKLGSYSWAQINKNLIVINAYTQLGFSRDRRAVSYDAIDTAFRQIHKDFAKGARIGYPLIGAGLGGGDWDIISTIIDCAFEGRDHTLVKYSV